jgi:restriction endonuclease S subunit
MMQKEEQRSAVRESGVKVSWLLITFGKIVEYSRKLITAANFKRHPWQSYEVGSRFNGVPLNLEDNDWKKNYTYFFRRCRPFEKSGKN